MSAGNVTRVRSSLDAADVDKLAIAGIVGKLSRAARNLVGRGMQFKARIGKP